METFEAKNPDFDQVVRADFERQGFMKTIGASLTDLRPGYCELSAPFRKEITQQHGFFHAGVSATLADVASGYAALSLAEEKNVMSTEFKINLLRPAQGEKLVCRAEVIKFGRTLKVCRAEVYSVRAGEEVHCATALATMMTMQ